MKDLTILIFFYNIQALLMVLSGMLFFNIRVTINRMVLISLCYGSALLLIRKLYFYFQIPLGTHTIVLMVIFCLLCVFIGRISFTYAIGTTLFSTSLIMLGGGIVSLVLVFFSINFEAVLNNVGLYILFGNLSENLFLIIFIIINRLFYLNINSLWVKH